MGGLRAESPDLREDLPAGAPTAGLFGVRFTLYALIQIIAWVCLMLMTRVVIHDDLLRPDAPETARHPDNVVSFTVVAMFALAIPIAFFTAGAFAVWAAIPVLIRAERWRRAGGTPRQLLTRIGRALRIPGQGSRNARQHLTSAFDQSENSDQGRAHQHGRLTWCVL
jgi:hypothetical protein